MSRFEIILCILLGLVVFGRLIGGLMGWLVMMFWIKVNNPKISKEEEARINKMWADAGMLKNCDCEFGGTPGHLCDDPEIQESVARMRKS